MIEVIRGADENVLLELFADDTETLPFSLVGATAEIVDGDIAPTVTVSNAALGQLQIVFADELTSTLKKDQRYKFRVKLTFPVDEITITPFFVVVAR